MQKVKSRPVFYSQIQCLGGRKDAGFTAPDITMSFERYLLPVQIFRLKQVFPYSALVLAMYQNFLFLDSEQGIKRIVVIDKHVSC